MNIQKIKQRTTIQASKNNLYLYIPARIVRKMNIEKGETIMIEVIDDNTMQIKFED